MTGSTEGWVVVLPNAGRDRRGLTLPRGPRRMCPGRGPRCRSMLVLAQDAAIPAAGMRNFRPVVGSPADHLRCVGPHRSKPSPRTNGPEDPGLG